MLVTHADGSQTVEEVKDDLGVTRDQYGARLRQQGIHATKIDTKGGVEDESSGGGGGGSLASAYQQRSGGTAGAATQSAQSSTYKKVDWFG